MCTQCVTRRQSPRLDVAIIVYIVTTWNRHLFLGGDVTVPFPDPSPISSQQQINDALANCVSSCRGATHGGQEDMTPTCWAGGTDYDVSPTFQPSV